MRDPAAFLDESWHRRWAEGEFGAGVDGLATALETVGELWEIPMPEYGRPFTPLVYGYMNMVLHFPGRHEERRRRGAYPGDWSSVDFNAMYLKGVDEARKGDLQEIGARLDRVLAEYPKAIKVFAALAAAASKNQKTAAMYPLFAEFKLLSAKVFSALIRKDFDKAALRNELLRLKTPLRDALSTCYEPQGSARLMTAWWEPLHHAVTHI